MLVHVCRELKPVYGLFMAQLLRKLEKAQQAASDSMSNEQGCQFAAGPEGYDGRPPLSRALPQITGQLAYGRMLDQNGMRQPQTKPSLHLDQHPFRQQGMTAQGEEVLIESHGVEFE